MREGGWQEKDCCLLFDASSWLEGLEHVAAGRAKPRIQSALSSVAHADTSDAVDTAQNPMRQKVCHMRAWQRQRRMRAMGCLQRLGAVVG